VEDEKTENRVTRHQLGLRLLGSLLFGHIAYSFGV
jgi:hypothetical protein